MIKPGVEAPDKGAEEPRQRPQEIRLCSGAPKGAGRSSTPVNGHHCNLPKHGALTHPGVRGARQDSSVPSKKREANCFGGMRPPCCHERKLNCFGVTGSSRPLVHQHARPTCFREARAARWAARHSSCKPPRKRVRLSAWIPRETCSLRPTLLWWRTCGALGCAAAASRHEKGGANCLDVAQLATCGAQRLVSTQTQCMGRRLSCAHWYMCMCGLCIRISIQAKLREQGTFKKEYENLLCHNQATGLQRSPVCRPTVHQTPPRTHPPKTASTRHRPAVMQCKPVPMVREHNSKPHTCAKTHGWKLGSWSEDDRPSAKHEKQHLEPAQ